MKAARVASYKLGGRRVEVWRGDALELPASIALFGRARALRERLEAIAGRPFEPGRERSIHGRRLVFLENPNSHWDVAVSLDYRPRRIPIDTPRVPPHLTHIDRLSDDLWWALWMASQRGGRLESILIVPLSFRNPEVVAVATVLAVWCAIVDGFPSGRPGRSCTFRLVDLDDPSPYIHALEDRDAMVTRALEAGAVEFMRDCLLEKWRRHHFVPTRPIDLP